MVGIFNENAKSHVDKIWRGQEGPPTEKNQQSNHVVRLFRRPRLRFWREIIAFSPLFYQK